MSTSLQGGVVFAGRYRVLGTIATGGMGAVYEVVHIETERRRALKVMLPHVLQSDELRGRFKLEARVAAHIDSDYIVEVFDAGIDEATDMPFLVMELLRGEELGKRLKRIGRFAPADVVTYLHQTALALDKTHRASIVHRDLKPQNLFLTERDDGPSRIKVLDFGVAKVVAETGSAGVTQNVGTPLYMAPEQFDPRAHLTAAADLYALGMLAYTLLVGAAYWREESVCGNFFALANVAMRGPIEPASVRAARCGVALPPGFDPWFARVTASDPRARFPTATGTVRALAEALAIAPPASAAPSLGDGLSMGPLPASVRLPPLESQPSSVAVPITVPGMSSTSAPWGPPRSRAGRVVAAGLGVLGLVGAGAAAAFHFAARPEAVTTAAPTRPAEPPITEPTPAPAPSSTVSVSAAPAPPSSATATKPTVKPKVTALPIYSRE